MMRFLGILLAVLMLAACQTASTDETPPIDNPATETVKIEGQRATPAEVQACARAGGTVERAGMLGFDMCLIPYADGGKVCSDNSECQGQCRTNDFGMRGKAVTGQCQPNNSPFGCYAEVKDGAAQSALCVD